MKVYVLEYGELFSDDGILGVYAEADLTIALAHPIFTYNGEERKRVEYPDGGFYLEIEDDIWISLKLYEVNEHLPIHNKKISSKLTY